MAPRCSPNKQKKEDGKICEFGVVSLVATSFGVSQVTCAVAHACGTGGLGRGVKMFFLTLHHSIVKHVFEKLMMKQAGLCYSSAVSA